MTFDAGRSRQTTTALLSTEDTDLTNLEAPKGQKRRNALGFDAAKGLQLPFIGRFNPARGNVLNGLLDLLRGDAKLTSKLMALGPVCSSEAAENPAGELFYHVHGGQPFVFVTGNQQDRVFKAACTVASDGFIKPRVADPRPVRVFTWSSAQGLLEVYPQDRTPAAYDANKQLIPHKDAPPVCERPGYNNEFLKEAFFPGRPTPDFQAPVEMLQAIDDTEFGLSEAKAGRAIFVMNGVGPYLREDLDSVTGRGRVYQQLVDLRPRMTTALTTKTIIFNDGPGLMPVKASELGSTFEMPLPTQGLLESTVFGAITNHLFTAVPADTPQREPASVTQPEIDAWRPIVGDNVKDDTLRCAVADGITLEAFQRFLPEKKGFSELSRQLVGFTLPQAQDLIGELVSRASLSKAQRLDFDALSKARFEMLKQNFNIELVRVDPDLPQPIGLERVIDKLSRVRVVFKAGKTRKKPLLPPKMMLLAGIPGMGKSLVAKKASELLDVPLFRVDLSLLFNKFVGQSEENFKRMFDLLESLSPCVVWLDEIEKALGGTAEGSQNVDAGVTQRAHGLLLTWLQEHKQEVLLLGTSNEPDKLSGALLSRTDEKYFVAFFDEQAAVEAWKSNLRAGTDAHSLTDEQLKELVHAKPSITGREIAQRIEAAREFALVDGGDELITIDHLKRAMEGWSTAYEQDPMRYEQILSLSSGYQPAGNSPVLSPASGKRPLPASRASQAKAEEDGGPVRQRTKLPGADD